MKAQTLFSTAVVAALLSYVSETRAETVTGLEAYGDLTEVDAIVCATDSSHEFHEYPANGSKVETILGESCRTLAHQTDSASFFSYRLGAGKNLVPGDMYLLVAEYPDDVPRTMTLINRAMDSRNGFHTGRSVGDTLNAHIIPQTHCESLEIPLAGAYKRIEQLMVLNENVYPYNSTDQKDFLKSATDGFDVVFQLFSKEDAPDSAGAAIKSIRLYHVNNEASLEATLNYPSDAPRRYITFREEMAKHSGRAFNADWRDWARHKARLMKVLGINCYSRDMLEFGYNQHFDVTCGGKYTDGDGWCRRNEDYYSDEVGVYDAAGLYQLPYYEYAGSRGTSGLGYNAYRRAVPLFDSLNTATHGNKFVQGSNGASAANVDLTDDAAYSDFRRFLECTILRYKDQANFVGAWIRNRGSMPVSFSDNTLGRFNAETGHSETRESILAAAKETAGNTGMSDSDVFRYLISMNQQPDIYKEYRSWWSGKRAAFLADMQQYLATNGIANAKIFFSGCMDEAGLIGKLGSYYNEYDDFVAAQDVDKWKALSGSTKTVKSIGWAAGDYVSHFLEMDEWTYYPYEYNHAAPKNDPETYTNLANIAISYPYNCIYSLAAANEAPKYRNGSDDLFFSRHYCLYEGCGSDLNGYFTCDMDRADRACMLPELYAVAYQDPTTIGFLQGNQLARNFTIPFKEFAENYLSLPAVKGTVVTGGGWGLANPTIRKYVVNGEQYYAVINLSGDPIASAWHVITDDPSVTKLYETVSGTEHAVGSNYMRYEMKPYQLLCFSTAKPGSTIWSAASSEVADRSATVTATVTSLKEDETGTLAGVVSASPDFADATALETKAVSAAGDFTWTLSGLTPVTTYYVKLVYTPNDGSSAEKTLSFTTLTPADWPSASNLAIDSVGVTNLTAKVTVDGLGEGAAGATVTFELAKTEDMGGAIRRSIVLAAAGEAAVPFGALNSETEYFVRATVSNSLGNVVTLDPVSATTKKISVADPFTGKYAPGLTQVKYGCEQSKVPDYAFDYKTADEKNLDRTLGTMMADLHDSGSEGKTFENPITGKSWKWVNNTTYAYFGEMYMKAGVTYRFAGILDDGETMFVGDTKIFESSSWANYGKGSYTPAADGWYPVRFYFFDWTGGKGPSENAGNKWGQEMGFGWKTNGTDSVEPASDWQRLRDPGDGSLLRTRTSDPELIRLSGVRQEEKRIWATVATELYDDDCRLEISISKSAEAKSVVKTIEPADRTRASVDVDTGYDVDGPAAVYVAAHLVNERTGYDFWTEPVKFLPKDDTPRCEFGAIVAEMDPDGTNATIRTTVVDVNGEPRTVELRLNGRTVNTWTGVRPSDELVFKADVTRYSTNVYAFVFTSGSVEVTSDPGVFIATTYIDWFTVRFPGDGTVDTDGGTLELSGEGTAVIASTNGVNAYLLDGADRLVYTASHPSETGADASVEGRVLVPVGAELPDAPDSVKIGFAFRRGMPYGYGADGWTALTGAGPFPEGEWTTYRFEFRDGLRTVTLFLGDAELSPPLEPAGELPCLHGVAFSGTGAIGDFRGAYLASVPPPSPIPIVRPEFVPGSGVGFSADGAMFSVTIGNAVEGAWYTLFAAETLDGDFRAESASVKASADGTLTLSLPVVGNSRFAYVVASDVPYESGDRPDHSR